MIFDTISPVIYAIITLYKTWYCTLHQTHSAASKCCHSVSRDKGLHGWNVLTDLFNPVACIICIPFAVTTYASPRDHTYICTMAMVVFNCNMRVLPNTYVCTVQNMVLWEACSLESTVRGNGQKSLLRYLGNGDHTQNILYAWGAILWWVKASS